MTAKTPQKPVQRRKPAGKEKPHAPAKQRSGALKESRGSHSQELARRVPSLPERIETLLMQGDLTGLSVQERLTFYKSLCRSLGLNPLTRPFEYIVFTDKDQDEQEQQQGARASGKMILYARADCAAQLRKIHKVGIGKDMRRRRDGDFYICEADAFVYEKAGVRTDTSTGVVWLKKVKWNSGKRTEYALEGRDLANAMMKAETKAKRRVTFSICGLHILDESEIEDLTNIAFDVSDSGRVIEVKQPAAAIESGAEQQNPGAQEIYELAVLIAQRDVGSSLAFKDRVDNAAKDLRGKTPAQIAKLLETFRSAEQQRVSRPATQPPTAESGRAEGSSAAKQEQKGAPARTAATPTYDGLELGQYPNGVVEIRGPEALLHKHREMLRHFWKQNANPPGLYCTGEEAGRLMRQLELLQIKFRMVNV